MSIPRWALHHGDALDVLRTLSNESVDAVITDPPYSSGGAFRGDRMLGVHEKYVQTGTQIRRPDFDGDNRDQRAYGYWCALWLSECLRIAKPGAPIVVFTDWRQLPTTTDAVQAGGWVWRGIGQWDKPAHRPRMGGFSQSCEYAVWGTRGPMDAREDVGCLPGTWRVTLRQDDKHHVTGKPTELMRQVARICPPDGVILDPFAGSGSTGVGAMREGRRFIGIERDNAYVAVARRRLAESSAAPDLFAA